MQGDIANQPELFLRHPDWHNVFEHDPIKAAATRRRIYDMVAAENMVVAVYHFPLLAYSFVEKDGTAYRLIQVN